MLFVGIDQHKRHLTVCIRDEQGNVSLRRQVSTKWENVDPFLASLQELGTAHGSYVAVVDHRSVANHLTHPQHRFVTLPLSVLGFPPLAGLGFAVSQSARRYAQPNRVRHPTDR